MTPSPRLDAESIVRATLDLLDEEGFAALSMRTLANRLGVKAASLYYHVPNKSALLQLIADRIGTEVASELKPGRWDDLLRGIAIQLRRALRRHPGSAAIVAIRNVSPDVFSGSIPIVLASLRDGLTVSDDDALYLVQSLYILVIGHALAEFGDVPLPPVADAQYYDTWFDTAVSTFLAGIEARYGFDGV